MKHHSFNELRKKNHSHSTKTRRKKNERQINKNRYSAGLTSMNFQTCYDLMAYESALLSWVPYMDRNYWNHICNSLRNKRRPGAPPRANLDGTFTFSIHLLIALTHVTYIIQNNNSYHLQHSPAIKALEYEY